MELEESPLNQAKEIAEHTINNPKVQALTASTTTGLAIDYQMMEILPQIISVVGGALGLVLTSMMIYLKWMEIRKERDSYAVKKREK